MRTPDEFRAMPDQCISWSPEVPNTNARDACLILARVWLKAAGQEEAVLKLFADRGDFEVQRAAIRWLAHGAPQKFTRRPAAPLNSHATPVLPCPRNRHICRD